MALDTNPTDLNDRNVISFAQNMKRIPRKTARCELYGDVTVVLDRAHAKNILRKVYPGASSAAVYTALCILQERLDNSPNLLGTI
jgi:hypothetical protein